MEWSVMLFQIPKVNRSLHLSMKPAAPDVKVSPLSQPKEVLESEEPDPDSGWNGKERTTKVFAGEPLKGFVE
jgi:hypothetical protein